MVDIGLPTATVPDNGWKLWVTSVVMVIVSGLFTIWRCATRLSTRQFGADDYMIIASQIFSIALSVCINEAVVNGYGKHRADLSSEQLSLALEWFYTEQITYKMTLICYKISVPLFYKRIFITKSFMIACWSVIAMVIVWGFIVVFLTIFQCWPVQGAWEQTMKATCIDNNEFWIAFAVSNILTDVIILALPIPPIARLKLALREKLLLIGVFLLGSFVVVTSILRATIVADALDARADVTWHFVDRSIWTLVEANVGIICACLPILKRPFMKGIQAVFGRRRDEPEFELDHSGRKGSTSWVPATGPRARPLGAQPFGLQSEDETPVMTRTYRTDESSKESLDAFEKASSKYQHEELRYT